MIVLVSYFISLIKTLGDLEFLSQFLEKNESKSELKSELKSNIFRDQPKTEYESILDGNSGFVIEGSNLTDLKI